MIRVYLAGAIGCYGKNNKEPLAWRKLAERYFKEFDWNFMCINPMDYYSYNNDSSKKYSEIMRFDLRKVESSDVILVNLKDVDKSLGTSDEILYAYLHNIPIIGFIETENVLKEVEVVSMIHQWKYEQIDRIETGKDAMDKAIRYIKDYYYF